MRKIIFILITIIISSLSTTAQKKEPAEITILYYNADSLFDINDGAGMADNDYHPESVKAWDSKRYKAKINSIAGYISDAGNKKNPDIIGLSGVENRSVVNDILNSRSLKRADYEVHMIESQGLDIALLTNKEIVTIRDIRKISIDSTFAGSNIIHNNQVIYFEADIKGPGRCHLFINNWPGIKNDYRLSGNLRMGAAIALRKSIDEIFNFERDARIIIMGTFNAEPTSRSLMTALNATNKRKNFEPRDLYNLFYDSHNIDGLGTVIVNRAWLMWDQIIVSSSLMSISSEYHIEPSSGKVYMPEEIMEDNSTLKSTYEGGVYTGGVSSHLPVHCIIKRNE